MNKPPDPQATNLQGTVERIVYANEDNGWTVMRLNVRGQGEVTVVGRLITVQAGENLKLQGAWTKDRKFGWQFRAETLEPVRPESLSGIEKYLASGLIEGIGPAMAERLVKKFGLDTLDIIDRQPERLLEVEGIGAVRRTRIIEAWRGQRHLRDLMVVLKAQGISTGLALKIQRRYGENALEIVRTTPHRLAQEVFGIGFLTADRLARDLGTAPDAPDRIRAGLAHLLNEAAERGHLFVPESALLSRAAELLELDATVIIPELERALADHLLARRRLRAGEPLILLHSLDRVEQELAAQIHRLTAQRRLPLRVDVDKAISWFEEREAIQLAERQKKALAKALDTKLMILTGGPGTGKTTLQRGVVEILKRKGLKILLAAPTGRAAKRLSEATGLEARTIHRLLEFQGEERRFLRGLDNPLTVDLLIVDEASMLDVHLALALTQALPSGARLLLVGDVDQLPSIGPGRVLADLIDSGTVEVERLNEIFRQAQKSWIVKNAHRVRDGLMPLPADKERESDFFFIERQDPEAILATLKHLVVERIPNHFGISAESGIQILTPMQRGLLGAANLNAELQALLNPEGQAVPAGAQQLRLGDRVMQRRNNYDLGVWNGDLGKVIAFDLGEQRATIDFDGRLVIYPFADLDELGLAYACSIHKSQGSEYPCVVLPLHSQHFALLERNLLYTAITRAKRLVVIVGSGRALAQAVRQQGSVHRNTLLIERLRGQLPAASGSESL